MTRGTDEFRDLMRRVCAGSRSAAEELVSVYGPTVLFVVRRRLSVKFRWQCDSHDVAQEVWTNLFCQPEVLLGFRYPEELIRYLTVVAQNQIMEERRRVAAQKRLKEPWLDASTGAVNEPASRDPGPVELAVLEDEFRMMMYRRNHRDRQIIMLRIGGLDADEIAVLLGIGVRTVQRVLQAVRVELTSG